MVRPCSFMTSQWPRQWRLTLVFSSTAPNSHPGRTGAEGRGPARRTLEIGNGKRKRRRGSRPAVCTSERCPEIYKKRFRTSRNRSERENDRVSGAELRHQRGRSEHQGTVSRAPRCEIRTVRPASMGQKAERAGQDGPPSQSEELERWSNAPSRALELILIVDLRVLCAQCLLLRRLLC